MKHTHTDITHAFSFFRISICVWWIFSSVILSHRKSFVAIGTFFSIERVRLCKQIQTHTFARILCVLDCVWCWCCRIAGCEMGPWIYFPFFLVFLSPSSSFTFTFILFRWFFLLLLSFFRYQTLCHYYCCLYLVACLFVCSSFSSLLLLLSFLHFLLMAFLAIDNR